MNAIVITPENAAAGHLVAIEWHKTAKSTKNIVNNYGGMPRSQAAEDRAVVAPPTFSFPSGSLLAIYLTQLCDLNPLHPSP
jgi:hypothetical protein